MARNTRRIRRSFRPAVVTALLVFATYASWTAHSQATPPNAGKGRGVITIIQGEGQRNSGKYVEYFVDETGRATLTNRPEKYRNDPNYTAVRVKLEPIFVPGRYRFYDSSKAYRAEDVLELVELYSRRYSLDKNLVLAVIQAESNFNPHAVSKAGARGLMQLMPGTAGEMGVRNLFDPAQNVAGGTQYLSKLFGLFDGKRDLALAAYNAGPETVKRYGGIPPYKETRDYVARVNRFASVYAQGKGHVTFAANDPRPEKDYLPATGSPFVLHFVSGTTQPAESVQASGDYYVIEYAGRTHTIRKDLVTKIERLS